MSERAALAMAIHFHQPVGNLDSVVRRATDRCYRPFLETLAEFPDLPITLHYSGCLLEWLEANASDVTDLLRRLCADGRVELMTGGFYEPILAALPERDRVGQIEMLTSHLEDSYGASPTGLWLTERVWESDVVPALVDTGVRYTILDDTMFHSVGVPDEELVGPFVTEHDGRPLLVYAGDRRLRYAIPYRRLDRTLDRLRSEGDRLFVYADDGEKFGEWPDTYERVYDRGWLRSFFEALTAASGWLDVTTLGTHAAAADPVGRVYLPSSSYDEMMTWALPTDARLTVGALRRELQKADPSGVLPFVKGAPWRAFLAKYPEVNALHKRMLDVSRRVHSGGGTREAITALYRAQCNCAYWHGAFGGVYLGFMRSALWHHLMRAEAMVAPARQRDTEAFDLDADGREEVMLRAPWGVGVVSALTGGLAELDDHGFGANLLAVAARHREAYHVEDENPPEETEDDEMQVAQARADIDRSSLVFDEVPFGGALDTIAGARVSGPYTLTAIEDGARLVRDTELLRIDKSVTVDAEGVVITTIYTNNSAEEVDTEVGSETAVLPLSLGRDIEPDKVDASPTSWFVEQPEGEVAMRAEFEPAGGVSWTTIETAAATLEGLQLMRQGTLVTTSWQVSLPPGGEFATRVHLRPAVRHDPSKRDLGVSA